MTTTLHTLKTLEREQELEDNREIDIKDSKGQKCWVCNCSLDDAEKFYFCVEHKKFYCYNCARNGDKAKVNYLDTKHCCNNNPFPINQTGREVYQDCIMELKSNAE